MTKCGAPSKCGAPFLVMLSVSKHLELVERRAEGAEAGLQRRGDFYDFVAGYFSDERAVQIVLRPR